MNAITLTTGLIERTPIPDSVVRLGIVALCERTNRKLAAASGTAQAASAAYCAGTPSCMLVCIYACKYASNSAFTSG